MLLAVLGFYIVGVGAIDDPKKHKDTFLLSYFCMTKSTKSQKEESIPLLNSFCRLAATSANKVPRPSRYSFNHGYRLETLKRRLGFTAVPCQAMANLAGRSNGAYLVRTYQNKIYFDSSVSVDTGFTMPRLGDALLNSSLNSQFSDFSHKNTVKAPSQLKV